MAAPWIGVPPIASGAAGLAGVAPTMSSAGDVEWRASLKLFLGAVEGTTEGLDEGGTTSRDREKAMAGWDFSADASRNRECSGVAFTWTRSDGDMRTGFFVSTSRC